MGLSRSFFNAIYIGRTLGVNEQRVVAPKEVLKARGGNAQYTGASWRQFRIDFDRRGDAD